MRRLKFHRGVILALLLSATTAGISAWPASVRASADYSQAVLALQPAAYWRLGESSGTIAYDSSPYGRNATYAGAPLLGQPGAIADDPDTSVGFNMNGTSNYALWTPPSGDSYSG